MPFFGSLGTFIIRTVFVVAVILNAVTTFAGTGGAGFENNVKPFSYLSGITIDSSGNLYVSDQNNNSIGKITPENVVTRLAGNGNTSSVDGSGTNATFYWPSGITIDSSGNLYVGEYAGHVVRKITPAGVVTTLAGSGTGQSLDGTGTNARFYSPNGIAIDLSGNLYVSDLNGSKLRKVTSAGVVTTLAGSGSGGYADGTGTNAQFLQLSGLTVDSSGNVFLADRLNHRIRKITSAGVVTTLAGSGTGQGTSTGSFADGTGTNARFSMPQGVAVDSSGNVYVVDGYNHRIRKVTSAGVVTTFAGNGTLSSVDGTGTNATFFYPSSILIDSSGNLYIGDGNNTIRKITPSAVVTTLSATTYSNIQAQFNTPFGVATDWNGTVYVADQFNHRIRRITSAGVVTTLAGSGTTGSTNGTGTSATFNFPRGVALDSVGNVYVADSTSRQIRRITPAGVVTTFAGSTTSGFADGTGTSATFNTPVGITVDPLGTVYVSDIGNHRIRRITSAGVVTTFAGTTQGSTDGVGTNARFDTPSGIVADIYGNVYVADTNNHDIRRISSDGTVTTLAGSTAGFADETGINARFNFPYHLSIDALGTLYVADQTNNRIRTVQTSTGVVSTLAGDGTVGFTPSRFNTPQGITVDRFRNAYVGDTDNHSIRKVPNVYTLPENNGVVTTAVNTSIANISFYYPCGITLDSVGNLYTYTQYRIYKITSLGFVTIFIGNGTSGLQDGTGTGAIISQVFSSVFDSENNLYFADYNNSRIRRATPGGVVTTFAGSSSGQIDGTGAGARFNVPWGIAIDLSGNLYVADSGNFCVRMITPSAVVTTLAGNAPSRSSGYVDGTGTNARFESVSAITIDSNRNVYVLDSSRIRRITPAGVVTTLAGNGTTGFADGIGTNAMFHSGWPSLTTDIFGNVYLTDTSNHRIRRITPAGVVTTIAGQATSGSTDGIGTNATFQGPFGITTDILGNFYISDQLNHRIRKIGTTVAQPPLNRGIVTTFAGQATSGSTNATGTSASFYYPWGVALDSVGNLYIGDQATHLIRKITPLGVVSTLAGTTAGSSSTQFNQPSGVAVDSAGNVYVADAANCRIRKVTPAGFVTILAGQLAPGSTDGTGTNASFQYPYGVAVDSAGFVYVADQGNHRIRKITPEGVVSTFAGNSQGSADGTGTNAQFNQPFGIAFDSAANVYVADRMNNCIRRITPAGVVTTLAGQTTAGADDGTGTNASFREPTGIAVDSARNVYVSEQRNHRIRKITPSGVVTTLAGSSSNNGNFNGSFADGTGTNARFDKAGGVAVDSFGNVYVADSNNNRIRKIQ